MQGIWILEKLNGLAKGTELLRMNSKRQILCLWLFFILEIMLLTIEIKYNEMDQEYYHHQTHSTRVISL